MKRVGRISPNRVYVNLLTLDEDDFAEMEERYGMRLFDKLTDAIENSRIDSFADVEQIIRNHIPDDQQNWVVEKLRRQVQEWFESVDFTVFTNMEERSITEHPTRAVPVCMDITGDVFSPNYDTVFRFAHPVSFSFVPCTVPDAHPAQEAEDLYRASLSVDGRPVVLNDESGNVLHLYIDSYFRVWAK